MNNYKTMKISIPIDRILSILCSTLVPAIINFIGILIFCDPEKENFDYILIISAIVGAITTLLLTIILHNYLPKWERFRPFRKYEGRWLQIIPELPERPISVFDFNYNYQMKSYVLKGVNFYKGNKNCIPFSAYKFIERDFHDGFYYITNYTLEHKNGLGKIGFIETDYDGLVRAEGYFFDASNEGNSKKYHTIMIKCDEVLAKKLYKDNEEPDDMLTISPKNIADRSQKIVTLEINMFKNKIQKETCSKCSSQNRCSSCSCQKRGDKK